MRTQISKMALEKLTAEMQKPNFTSSIINRLKNEDPQYAVLAIYCADKAKAESGDFEGNGFKLALECFAIAYRIRELSERYLP
jgi:hypothetical protein